MENNTYNESSGYVFNIQRFSLHDGPGIRTTVFFNGCPLRCQWCHNPECFTMSGTLKSIENVLAIILKDKPFYDNSGGGVTLSGGEPLVQYEFAKNLLIRCKEEGLLTALDTTLFSEWSIINSVLPHTDLFLPDIKTMDASVHKKWTGKENSIILANIVRLSDVNASALIRVPIIMGVNSDDKSIEKIGEFLMRKTRFREVELLSYHDYAEHKYDALGLPYYQFPKTDDDIISRLNEMLRKMGLNPHFTAPI